VVLFAALALHDLHEIVAPQHIGLEHQDCHHTPGGSCRPSPSAVMWQWLSVDLLPVMVEDNTGGASDLQRRGVGVYIVGRLVRARLGQMVRVVWSDWISWVCVESTHMLSIGVIYIYMVALFII
jgi:hypothetical protein